MKLCITRPALRKGFAVMGKDIDKATHQEMRSLVCAQCLLRCPFHPDKPPCSKCPVHCYNPALRERIREVMRYAGPRMLGKHPVMAVRHLIDGLPKPSKD
jgi:hypothetical protein